MINKKNTFLDLFTGCGGLSEGFYKQYFKSLSHVEIDKDSCETIRQRLKFYNYSNIDQNVLEKDINDIDTIELIKSNINNVDVDVIVGGPPCQSFSSLGRAKDKDSMRNDPRNFLFESYKRILDLIKPKIFVFENVTGLLSAKLGNQQTINVILEKLSENYNLINEPSEMVLNSCDYGVPQIRKRVFLIGLRKDINYKIESIYKNIIKTHYLPCSKPMDTIGKIKYVTVKDAIGDLPSLKPGEGNKLVNHSVKNWNDYLKKIRNKNDIILLDHIVRTHNYLDRQRFKEMSKNNWVFQELLEKRPDLNHEKKRVFNNSYVVQFWDKPSRTIIAHLYKDGNQFIHPDHKQERTLTVREAARLQSFPDDFLFSGSRTQQYKQIGNAVPPLMAEAIAKSIKKALKEIKSV
jgi:DNA (cytosine-5)-methyltransferase 1